MRWEVLAQVLYHQSHALESPRWGREVGFFFFFFKAKLYYRFCYLWIVQSICNSPARHGPGSARTSPRRLCDPLARLGLNSHRVPSSIFMTLLPRVFQIDVSSLSSHSPSTLTSAIQLISTRLSAWIRANNVFKYNQVLLPKHVRKRAGVLGSFPQYFDSPS